MKSKKYVLTDETRTINGHKVYRIRAERSFNDVSEGERGGFVESEANLSHYGNAWIGGDAIVYGHAYVSDNAVVTDKAIVCGFANVYGNARVCDNGVVCDNAIIYGDVSISGTLCGDEIADGEVSWKEIAAELCDDLDNDIDEVAERLAKFAEQFDFSKENMRTLCDLDSSWVFRQIYED